MFTFSAANIANTGLIWDVFACWLRWSVTIWLCSVKSGTMSPGSRSTGFKLGLQAEAEHAPWHHLTLKLHPGRLATTLPSMWHWTAALRAQSQPVACSSHTHSSINSPSFQLRNCELIRASVTTASPCWGHYLDQTLGSDQGSTLGWMA